MTFPWGDTALYGHNVCKLWRIGRFALMVFFCACHTLCAQDFGFDSPYFESVGDADSLPSGSISKLVQDSKGFLWIGTQNGLVRFDGYQFRRFTHSQLDARSLAGNYIETMIATPDGRVWIGTGADGLSVYDPSRDAFENYRHDQLVSSSLVSDDVRALAIDSTGGMWVGTDKGLDYWDPENKVFVHHKLQSLASEVSAPEQVRSVLTDNQGNVWVGLLKNGLYCREAGHDQFRHVNSDPGEPQSLAGKSIRALFIADDGKLWIGTREHGVFWLNPKDRQLHHPEISLAEGNLPSLSGVVTIAQPRPNEIWLGSTFGGGIAVLSAAEGKLQRYIRSDPSISGSLARDVIGALFVDRSGLLWIGTWGSGLQHYNPTNNAFRMVRFSPRQPLGLSHSDVLSILELIDGRILVGTSGNGIDIFDRKLGLVGAFRADPHNEKMLANGRVPALALAVDGTIWAGTQYAGLYHFLSGSDGLKRYTKSDGLPDNTIRQIMFDKQGKLWVGTNGGLAFWHSDSNQFEACNDINGNPSVSAIYLLAEDLSGRIWAEYTNSLAQADAEILLRKLRVILYGHAISEAWPWRWRGGKSLTLNLPQHYFLTGLSSAI